MIETVVVPLDGSPLAEVSLPLARTMAERTGASISLVRVISQGAPASARSDAQAYLAAISRKLNLQRAQTDVWLGDPAEQIVDRSASLPGAVIIMTTHGRTGINRWLYGSVADKVVHASPVPVLLVRSGAELAPLPHSILVPLDGSALSEAALPFARELARAFDATIHLTRVAETGTLFGMFGGDLGQVASADTIQMLVDELIDEVQKYLDGVLEQFKGSGLKVDAQGLEGLTVDQLLRYAGEVHSDLTVMATRGRSGMSRAVLGSIAEQMLKLGDCPILLVPPQAVHELPK